MVDHFIFVLSSLGVFGIGRARHGGEKLNGNWSARAGAGQKIGGSITPSSGTRHFLELCYTSLRCEGLHQRLAQSGVGWGRLPGCDPKYLENEAREYINIQ